MCDGPIDKTGNGWEGWSDLPSRPSRNAAGDWTDLTHVFSASVPRSAMFDPPKLTLDAKIPEQLLNVTRLETQVHVGTHVDAPRHFYADGPGMEAVPLTRLMGEGVVISLELEPCDEINIEHLATATPDIEPGDIVAINMSWSKRWGTTDWTRHPYLSLKATNWMIEKCVKLVAVDTATPDLPSDLRRDDFAFPVHRALLKKGILIAEQIANLEVLGGRRVEFLFCPIPIEGCDGSPARVLARALD